MSLKKQFSAQAYFKQQLEHVEEQYKIIKEGLDDCAKIRRPDKRSIDLSWYGDLWKTTQETILHSYARLEDDHPGLAKKFCSAASNRDQQVIRRIERLGLQNKYTLVHLE